MLKLELQKDRFKMPEHSHYMQFNKSDFENKLKVIKRKKNLFDVVGSLDNFVSQLQQSWTKGRSKDNVVISQIVEFAFIIASMSTTRREEFVRDLFFMAQKKGSMLVHLGNYIK